MATIKINKEYTLLMVESVRLTADKWIDSFNSAMGMEFSPESIKKLAESMSHFKLLNFYSNFLNAIIEMDGCTL